MPKLCPAFLQTMHNNATADWMAPNLPQTAMADRNLITLAGKGAIRSATGQRINRGSVSQLERCS